MSAHLLEWVTLFARWLHFAAGVSWIGASFYFIWLENALQRAGPQRDDRLAGHLWAIHGGGIYYLEKYKSVPASMPPQLHWFKWEAYTTWLSGMALMLLIFYFNADTWLLAPGSGLAPWQGIVLSLATLAMAMILYLSLCATPLLRTPRLLGFIGLGIAIAAAWALRDVFSPRATFIHLGAGLGTIMAANVLLVIIPNQKRLVASFDSGETPDPGLVRRGVLRSTHNNYLTLPVLLLMISGHLPGVYGHQYWPAVLAALIIGGASIRHALNLYTREAPWRAWGGYGIAALAAAMLIAAPWDRLVAPAGGEVSFAEVRTLVARHCTGCHSRHNTDEVFTVAPLGFILDRDALIIDNAEAIHQRTVVDRSMPFNNQTGMTEDERTLISRWFRQLEASGKKDTLDD